MQIDLGSRWNHGIDRVSDQQTPRIRKRLATSTPNKGNARTGTASSKRECLMEALASCFRENSHDCFSFFFSFFLYFLFSCFLFFFFFLFSSSSPLLLPQDLAVKNNSLFIDREKCMGMRKVFPLSPKVASYWGPSEKGEGGMPAQMMAREREEELRGLVVVKWSKKRGWEWEAQERNGESALSCNNDIIHCEKMF